MLLPSSLFKQIGGALTSSCARCAVNVSPSSSSSIAFVQPIFGGRRMLPTIVGTPIFTCTYTKPTNRPFSFVAKSKRFSSVCPEPVLVCSMIGISLGNLKVADREDVHLTSGNENVASSDAMMKSHVAHAYVYAPASRPVNRLADGVAAGG